MYERVRVLLRDATTGKKLQKRDVRDDWWRDGHKWTIVEMDFNHENDSYRKIVTDPLTARIIYKQEGRLSEHTGHGSDRH